MKTKEIKDLLKEKNMTLSTCESLTAGLIGSLLGATPGISEVYAGGLITYMTKEKEILADVSHETLETYGAVSAECAKEMASGTAKKLGTDIAVSATGNAGPSPMEDKPVGLVYIGISCKGNVTAKEYHFEGNRDEIRKQAAEAALLDVYQTLSDL